MTDEPRTIRPFYDGWQVFNERLVGVVRKMTDEQLAIRPDPERWPIWATVGHTAGARVYWLCGVFREPGAETTPFPDPLAEEGWEDDESHPRSAAELVTALETTWRIIERCLDTWTPESLSDTYAREYAGNRAEYTRQHVLMRMLTHEAYHCGELSQTLGIHNLPQIDLWARSVP
jgi:uncharacterized damage-inducible protein DinB